MKNILLAFLFVSQFFLFTSSIYAYQVDIYGENWDIDRLVNSGGSWLNTAGTNFLIKENTGMKVSYFGEAGGFDSDREFGYFLYDQNGITHKEAIGDFNNSNLESGDTWEFTAANDTYLGFYYKDIQHSNTIYSVSYFNERNQMATAIWDDPGGVLGGWDQDREISKYILGFNDNFSACYRDYQDFVFTTERTAGPAGGPAPAPLVTAVISLFTFGVLFLKKKRYGN